MDMDIRQQGRVISRAVDRAEIDEGLRSYMLRVYNYMASGLALTGIVAYLVSQSPAAMHAVFGTPLFWLVVLAPLGLVFFLSARINRMQASTAQALFWVYAALMGVSLASIFVVYTGTNIARVFFIAILVNMFLHSTGLLFALSVIGALVFAGLTAYDTQSIKEMYFANDMGEVATKKSVLGALRLYLDFLNLFLLLLQLFGNQRN